MIECAAKYGLGHIAWGIAAGLALARFGGGADWPDWSIFVFAAIGMVGMVRTYKDH